MNYYSIEYFKYYLKLIKKDLNSTSADAQQKIEANIKNMMDYIKVVEDNNKSAYNKKWMKKPVFNK